MTKFYITTAIDYPNANPHLGHAYEKICADIIARWHRMLGEEVFFLTGTDEHGRKIQLAAEKKGMSPKEFVDQQVKAFKEMDEKLEIKYDRFIRTTEKDHEEKCQEIFKKVYEKGDIYLGEYEGFYCTDCETFYLERELCNGNCPIHGKKCEWLKQKSYFFRMSKYEKAIRKYFEKKFTVLPARKKKEILYRMKDGLRDLSISRNDFEWGIPVPIDKKAILYVWFDALLNYITGIDYPSKRFEKFWPADVHLIGNDILWHHTVIWWSILMAAGIKLPKTVFVHGFINTASGEKMSKSKGTIIDPIILVKNYGADALRYYLAREIPFGEDGFFSEELLVERINNELVNDLGNLVYRVVSMIEKYFEGKVPSGKADKELEKELHLDKIKMHMKKYELHLALNEIMHFVKACNKYVNEKTPWKLEGKELEQVIYTLADGLRVIAILLHAFMPETSTKICKQLGIELGNLKECKLGLLKGGGKLGKKEMLFTKKEIVKEELPVLRYEREKGIEKELNSIVLEVNDVNVQSKSMPLERIKKADIGKINVENVLGSELMKEYWKLMGKRDYGEKPAPVKLLEYVKKTGKIPTINTVTDAYNLVSAKTGIVMGAYDRKKIGNVLKLKIAEGNEYFVPIGESNPVNIVKGEYVYITAENKVVTRLLSKEAEYVKVDKNSKNIVMVIQGNKAIKDDELLKVAKEVAELIVKICGGKYRILSN